MKFVIFETQIFHYKLKEVIICVMQYPLSLSVLHFGKMPCLHERFGKGGVSQTLREALKLFLPCQLTTRITTLHLSDDDPIERARWNV